MCLKEIYCTYLILLTLPFILDLSLTNDGTVFYFRTNRDAPRNKVVKYNLAKPEEVKESYFFLRYICLICTLHDAYKKIFVQLLQL